MIDPNVGDSELVRVDFDRASISLQIKLAQDAGHLTIKLLNPRWFSFSTDCSQNIIEGMTVTENLSDALVGAPQDIRDLVGRRRLGDELNSVGQLEPLQAIVIRPVAGPVLRGIADKILFENDGT